MISGYSWVRTCHLPTLATATAAIALAAAAPARAAEPPINIGVVAAESALDGASIVHAAQMATDDINHHGGIGGRQIQLFTYDTHSSSADGVRAFQRAVSRDHAIAVIGDYISEVALAMEPWAARLKVPFIITGAASTDITKHVHDDYDHYKYAFHEWINSNYLGQSVCDSSRDILVKELGYKTAVIMSEDAAWTKPLDASYQSCLGPAGLKVVDTIRFNPDTTDFTPIFNKIEGEHPDAIITGISHVGVQPTVQWHEQQVPILMAGISAQASTSSFWKDTNGATEGIVTETAAAPGAAITAKTVPFTEAYTKRFGITPAYDSYSTYDAFNVLKAAIERAGSTDPEKLVDALEKTDYTGTIGQVQFYPKDNQYAHGMKYGTDYVTGIMIQWQKGKQVPVWPAKVAQGKVVLPSFIKSASGGQHAQSR